MTSLLAGGAVFGGAIAAWGQIKTYLLKAYGLFVIRFDVKYDIAHAMRQLLWSEFSCSPLGKKSYVGSNEYVRPIQRNQVVGFEKVPNEPTIW